MFDWADPDVYQHQDLRRILSHIDAFRLPTLFNLKELSEAMLNDQQLREILDNSEHPLKLRKLTWGPEHTPFYCDVQESNIRPYVPTSFRRKIFDLFHNTSHPNAKVTDKLIRQQYVWPNMHRDINHWCKNCLSCQQSKVTRHNKFLPSHFTIPDARFQHVHIDIVGPLPISNGYKYLLTMIDRFTRWPEAVPIVDITANTIARTFYDTWVSRFGSPEILTTDQGTQFESRLFNELQLIIGTKRIHTTAYHPQSNGMVERWHRDLKAALMCRAQTPNWSQDLSTVLFGLRTRVRLDTGVSPVELVYGSVLRIPGDFCPLADSEVDVRTFYQEFRNSMRDLRPVPIDHKSSPKLFVHKNLDTCSHVLLLVKAVKPPLTRPYLGPYKVISRSNDIRTFVIDVNGTHKTVHAELLKPAYFIAEETGDTVLQQQVDNTNTVHRVTPSQSNASNNQSSQPVTRAQIHQPNDSIAQQNDETAEQPVNQPVDSPVVQVSDTSDTDTVDTQTVRDSGDRVPQGTGQPKKTKFIPNILRKKRNINSLNHKNSTDSKYKSILKVSPKRATKKTVRFSNK